MKFVIITSAIWMLLAIGFTPSLRAQNPIPASPATLPPRTASAQGSTSPSVPTTAADTSGVTLTVPAPISAASGDYVLAPSDTIEMSVFHQPDLTTRSPIASDGTVQFPLIGELKVGGLALRNAREIIRKHYNADYLVEPQVYLNVVAYAQRTFTILGQVAKPGTYDLPGGKSLSLLEGVGVAGGFTRLANRGSVAVKRNTGGSEKTLKIKNASNGKDFQLQPNDVVTVGESWF